jgi:hypothetical protein
MERYGTARHATDDNVKWSMYFACWITKATHTHPEYDTSCFSRATMVTQMHLNFMFIHTFLFLSVLQSVNA